MWEQIGLYAAGAADRFKGDVQHNLRAATSAVVGGRLDGEPLAAPAVSPVRSALSSVGGFVDQYRVGSISVLLFLVLFVLFAIQPVNASGQSRLALLFYALSGRAALPTDQPLTMLPPGSVGDHNSTTFSQFVPSVVYPGGTLAGLPVGTVPVIGV